MGAQWKVINENYKNLEGYKRVAWPPASEERIVREFTPQPQTQYQPVPAYNQQQQQPPSAAKATPAQAPIYNNVSHQAPTNINNMARDCISPYKPNLNPNQIQYEAFPPQTPETPIILKDKQFSRQASQEPNQMHTLPYHQQQQQQHQHQQQQYQYQQPQNQPIQQYGQQQYGQQQQHYQHHQEPYYQQQQQQQQPIHYPSNQQEQMPQQQLEQHAPSGWKPIRPPQTKQEHLFTSPSGIRESTPSMTAPVYQQQYQNYQQQPQQQQQPPQQYYQQQYRAPSYDIYQQPQQQQQQYPPQAQYQSQAPLSQNQYQQPPQAVSPYQQQPPQQQPAWAQQQQPQQQYQQPPWVQQPQPNQQYQQQPQYQSPLNQYNQAPNHHQAQQQHHQQQPQQQQQQQYNNQYVSQSNQQQFNSYSQPQQQQNIVSHDQVDQHNKLAQDQRGVSPGIITLRKEAPITQQPAPVYSSQPAAISFRESSADVDSLGGSNMRGDLKWPPPEYKEAAAKENEERRKLALGPVCRPRKVKRDYTEFFAKNALSHHYPSYKVPPGTQHMTY